MYARVREEALLAVLVVVLWVRRRCARRYVCLVISGRSRCRWSSDEWTRDDTDSSSEERRSIALWLSCRDGEEIRRSVSAARGRPTGWKVSWVCTDVLEVKGSPEGPQVANMFCILPVQRASMMTRRK